MAAKTIEVQGLGKKFCRSLKHSLWYGFKDMARELAGLSKAQDQLRKHEFWALRDLEFSLAEGESLGLIGPNGAGKTTLLRILNGLVKPSMGYTAIRGRVGALIALGAGFNPILTGRENVFINAAVLGIPRREVEAKLEAIVEFAEIGPFIDAPVQTYSSGMQVRLGFSVAIHMKPDVLLVDEVLAVGDMAFARKCFTRMSEILTSGVTVIFVSHTIRHVERICQKALLLDGGKALALGKAWDVCQEYYALANLKSLGKTATGEGQSSAVYGKHADPENFRVTRISLLNDKGESAGQFVIMQGFKVRVEFIAKRPIKRLAMGVLIQTLDGIHVISLSNFGQEPACEGGEGYLECSVKELPLREGAYTVLLGLSEDEMTPLFKSEKAADFSVVPDKKWFNAAGATGGLVVVPAQWEFTAGAAVEYGGLGKQPALPEG